MGYSKTFLFLGLVFAVLLLISSDVSAHHELDEAAQTQENVQTVAVEEAKYGHGHGGHGGHGGHRPPGHGGAGETETNQN